MKYYNLIAVLLFAAASLAYPQSKIWKIDNTHSSIGFSVKHLVISEVEGNFKKFSGSMTSAKSDFSDAKIEFLLETSSISTDNEQRDNHLKSADFFDAAKFSEIKFISTSFKKISGNKYKLKGDFTMKGITKQIVLDVIYGGTAEDPWGNIRAGFKIYGSVNRFDYGLKWNQMLEAGGAMVGKDVSLNCKVEIVKSK
jgi:polyisoprenoid-binding protein YceI